MIDYMNYYTKKYHENNGWIYTDGHVKPIGYVKEISVDRSSTDNSFETTITISDPKFANKLQTVFDAQAIGFSSSFNPFAIRRILVNPKKNATTVLWADGTHTVVKRSEGDEPADIWSVVSYALAEKVYGSNSAFKREVKGKVERMKE